VNVSKMALATAIAIVLTACLLGCAPIPVEGRYSYNTTTDFSEFKSFALLDMDEDIFSTPEGTAHFRKAFIRTLSEKGFTENTDNPDFLIYVAPVSTYREMYALAGNIEIPKAMLRVSFDRASGGVNIYEGAAFAYYEPSWSQEEKNSTIDEAIRVILAEFPPDP
jgi:hypothetical protein